MLVHFFIPSDGHPLCPSEQEEQNEYDQDFAEAKRNRNKTTRPLMQLAKQKTRSVPTFHEKDSPFGVKRQRADFNQLNNSKQAHRNPVGDSEEFRGAQALEQEARKL